MKFTARIASAIALLLAASSPTHAAYVRIQSDSSRSGKTMCWKVRNGSTRTANKIVLDRCDRNDDAQLFELRAYSPDKSSGCVSSGGMVTTGSCCKSVDDFPNTCLIGACGCSPMNSHDVNVCNCPAGMCFDGNMCVSRNMMMPPPDAKTYVTIHPKLDPTMIVIGVREAKHKAWLRLEKPRKRPIDPVTQVFYPTDSGMVGIGMGMGCPGDNDCLFITNEGVKTNKGDAVMLKTDAEIKKFVKHGDVLVDWYFK